MPVNDKQVFDADPDSEPVCLRNGRVSDESMATTSPARPNTIFKGKGRASDDAADIEQLNPVITYRHLQSSSFGVRSPLRVIALCDMDAFYAACEMARLGLDPSQPLVTAQWDMLIAVNYPARKYGISRMDKIKDALQRCPHLKVVHVATYKEGDAEPAYHDNVDTRTHKVSLDVYRRESEKINAIFYELLPTAEIEKASIDEAFIDLTAPVVTELLTRYPYLSTVPSETPLGIDTPLPKPPPIDWSGRGTLIPIHCKEGAKGEDVDPDDEKEHLVTWHDVALSIGAELMLKMRNEVKTRLTYTTTAGIARNKFLAKVASWLTLRSLADIIKLTASYKKPDNQCILRNAAITDYLQPMPFQKIRFLGGKLGRAIADEYSATTVRDLLSVPLDDWQRKFGEEAIWVFEIMRGIDRGEVKEKTTVNKSMLASKNLPKAITKSSEGPHWIRVLAAELALRLKMARETHPTLWPKTLHISIAYGWKYHKSRQCAFPLSRDPSTDVIAKLADRLWKELVGGESVTFEITHIGLAFHGIETLDSTQQGIEGFLRETNTSTKLAQADCARSSVPRNLPAADDTTASSSSNATVAPAEHPARSFVCSRCKKQFSIPADICDEHQEARLAALKMEHEDYHVAHDLSNSLANIDRSPSPTPPPSKKQRLKSKPVSKPQGIAKFFMKK